MPAHIQPEGSVLIDAKTYCPPRARQVPAGPESSNQQ